MEQDENKLPIYLASDHGGFELKQEIDRLLKAEGRQVVDLGPAELNPDDDYPDFAIELAEQVAQNPGSQGILLCRSGGGMVIAANKVPGIRAVAAETARAAEHARAHNNANVISIAADWTTPETAKQVVDKFLTTDFDGGRHQRRLQKIADYEQASL